MADISEIFSNPGFYILNLIGFATVIIMLMIWKAMGQSNFLPTWGKIAMFIMIPIASAVFTAIMGE